MMGLSAQDPCKVSSDGKKAMAVTLGVAQKAANLNKIALLPQAVVCALDLVDTPSNAETKIVFPNVELKPNHAKLQPKYPDGGFDLT